MCTSYFNFGFFFHFRGQFSRKPFLSYTYIYRGPLSATHPKLSMDSFETWLDCSLGCVYVH